MGRSAEATSDAQSDYLIWTVTGDRTMIRTTRGTSPIENPRGKGTLTLDGQPALRVSLISRSTRPISKVMASRSALITT